MSGLELLTVLDAFLQEHRRCGELEGGDALADLQRPVPVVDAAAVAAERRQVEQHMAHLMELAKMAGPPTVLAEEFRALERRRAQLEHAQRPPALPPAADLPQLRALLAEWRERIRSEMPIARQKLRLLFPDRIVFSPDAAQETVELRAD